MHTFKIGDLITNGTSAGKVIELVDRDPSWKTSGVRVMNIGLEQFGGDVGYSSFKPDYLLSDWRIVPQDWSPVLGTGGELEERYVWTAGYSRLQRELRRVEAVTSHG